MPDDNFINTMHIKNNTILEGLMTKTEGFEWLNKMLLCRAFEENAEEMNNLGKTYGTLHLSIGQEACAVGIRSAVKPTDFLFNTHRGHSHFLAWGGSLEGLMAELLGKVTGVCQGRGGSLHIADVSKNIIGSNGILGSNMAISLGYGVYIQSLKTDQIVVVVFGDGAACEGVFHESLNLASLWKLPILFFCENNGFAMSTRFQDEVTVNTISERGSAYHIPGLTIDGNDVLEVHRAVKTASEYIRQGNGPYLVEAKTYRIKGHSRSDRQTYRTRDEVKEWMKKDPINRFAKILEVDEDQLKELFSKAKDEIIKAVDYANNSPEPGLESIEDGVYA